MGRVNKKATAKNAVVEPVTAPQEIALSQTEQIAVEAVAIRMQTLEQQQQQFLRMQAETGKQWAGVLAEIEKRHGIPEGAIQRGEWAVIGGKLVKQGKKEPAEQVA